VCWTCCDTVIITDNKIINFIPAYRVLVKILIDVHYVNGYN